MLVTMAEMLQEAQKKNYAVPAPTVWNEESTRAALMAAENCKSPVILDYGYIPVHGRKPCLFRPAAFGGFLTAVSTRKGAQTRRGDPVLSAQRGVCVSDFQRYKGTQPGQGGLPAAGYENHRSRSPDAAEGVRLCTFVRQR